MARKKVNKVKITRGERLLYTYGIIALVFTISLKIFCGAFIGELKMSIEEINYNIDSQTKTNESLTMKVNELTSFENVSDVVKDMGLAYNNDNIVVVDE